MSIMSYIKIRICKYVRMGYRKSVLLNGNCKDYNIIEKHINIFMDCDTPYVLRVCAFDLFLNSYLYIDVDL